MTGTKIDLNPQAEQMADESMLRTLRAQAAAIWPQERELIKRYGLAADCRILDAGCGSGQITGRLAAMFPNARLDGIDLLEDVLHIARATHTTAAERIHFSQGDVYALDFDPDTFDLTLCRHLLQAIPEPGRVIDELIRVTRPGGTLHLVAEDYGMLHMPETARDADPFWHSVVIPFARATGTDARIGRHLHRILVNRPLLSLRVDFVTVDTLRVPRQTLADLMVAWRDGYSAPLVRHGDMAYADVVAHFDAVIDAIHDPNEYVLWQVPVWSATLKS